MNICIPVNADEGLASPVCAHFGSAPFFMIIDTASGACRALPNGNQHHAHGMCQPLAALAGENLDAIVVGGIGMGPWASCWRPGSRCTRRSTRRSRRHWLPSRPDNSGT